MGPFGEFLSPARLEVLWYRGFCALGVAVGVEVVALVASLTLKARLQRALSRGGGLDGSFRLQRRHRIAGALARFLRWGLWAVGFILILDIFRVNILPIVVLMALAGAAALLAGWRALLDAGTGLFLLLDDAVAVGDTVTVNGVTGRVEDMGTRFLRILDDRGASHFVFHSHIQELVNHTRAPQQARAE